MKKFTYFDFLRGEKVTVREILEKKQCLEKKLSYFILALNETEEKIRISIDIEEESIIMPNSILFFAIESDDVKGLSFWQNGLGPFGVELP